MANPGENDDDLLTVFLTEAREHLAGIESDLLAMENAGADTDDQLVNRVFRAAHSLKGGAGFLDLNKIRELAHKTENVLSMIRSKDMVPNSEVINVLLRSFDKLREMIDQGAASEQEDISEHVASLVGLASSFLPSGKKASLEKTVKIPLPGTTASVEVSEFSLERALKDGNSVYILQYDLIHDVHRQGKTPLDELKLLLDNGLIIESLLDFGAVGTLDEDFANQIPLMVIFAAKHGREELAERLGFPLSKIQPYSVSEKRVSDQSSGPTANAAGGAASDPHKAGTVQSQADATLRVSVNVLESLMNLAGELVLGRNQLADAIGRGDLRAVATSGQRVSMVTSELQETIMLARMQPIGNVLNKFPRVVRDLARDLGKEVELEITGKDVAVDKAIVEGLSDPLTHMVRNAVDHGIETPAKRQEAGKAPVGKVSIRAFHEAGQIVIEVSDDGKGLDAKKIAAAALAKNLVNPDQLKSMSEKEMVGLIFLPGLSTAEKITDVSGRGVGMDVVRANLENLGGKAEIETRVGQGTTFRIKLPLTLAIIPSLVVSEGEERFAIPQVNIDELIRIPAEQVKKRVEIIGDVEVLVLRGALIPLVHLADVLGIERTYLDPADGTRKKDRRRRIADRRSPRFSIEDKQNDRDAKSRPEPQGRRHYASSDINVVIVNTGVFQYGLIVEKLHASVEIVVKPLGQHLKMLKGYAGSTIMGDGQVALILDVAGIVHLAGLTSVAGSARAKQVKDQVHAAAQQDLHSLLLFRNSPADQIAVPLELVSRVEQIRKDQVETIGGKRTMKYRGASLPLVSLKDVAQVRDLSEDQEWVVIVFEMGDHEVGLLGAKPLDIVETALVIDSETLRQKGVMGSAIIKDETTLLVDVFEVVEGVFPEWKVTRGVVAGDGKDVPVVLLAEDSDFFRNQLSSVLSSSGYQVLAAEDGQVAWEILQKNEGKIRLLVTDIEMPRMTGFELSQKIRSDSRFSGLPIIAVTSLAGEEDVAKGKAAGITDYQVKLDKGKLLESVRLHLESGDAADSQA